MKTLGNILWLVLGGVWLALAWLMWAGILALWDVNTTVWGVPLFPAALFALWALLILALAWLMWAGILALTIVGIPFGLQCIKLAEFSLWPFGRQAVADPSASKLGAIGAVLWFIPGCVMFVAYVSCGVALCLTIIGIPFGIQTFKMAFLLGSGP